MQYDKKNCRKHILEERGALRAPSVHLINKEDGQSFSNTRATLGRLLLILVNVAAARYPAGMLLNKLEVFMFSLAFNNSWCITSRAETTFRTTSTNSLCSALGGMDEAPQGRREGYSIHLSLKLQKNRLHSKYTGKQ